RVEILGTLKEAVRGLEAAADSSLMDGLVRARTLGEIVEKVASALGRAPVDRLEEETPTPSAEGRAPIPETSSRGRRLTLEVTPAPRPEAPGGLMPGGVVIVTDDGRGVADALGQSLRAAGHPVELIAHERIDLASPASVEALLGEARGIGPIAGIIHALP